MNKIVKITSVLTLAFFTAAGMLAAPAVHAGSVINAPDAHSAAAAASTSTAKTPTRAEQKAFIRSSANFSIRLFRKTAAGESGSVMVAPMSVLTAMTMTGNGAGSGSATLTQMQKVLAGGMKIQKLDRCLQWWTGRLTSSGSAKIRTANSIWYRDSGDLTVNDAFLQTNKKYLNAGAYKSSFTNSETVPAMNKWVSDSTDGMIPSIIETIGDSDMLYLLDAVSFDAAWKDKYNAEQVSAEKFTAGDGTKQTVDMMSSEEMSYIKDGQSTGFIKPYKKGYSFVAILPNKGVTVKQYVSGMTGTKFRKMIRSEKESFTEAGIPKFTCEYTKTLNDTLKSLGITDAFSENADFSKMGTLKNGGLCIGNVLHKTYITVNENGTRAGAVTSVGMNATSAYTPHKVILNRPFVYAIIDNHTDLPVFIGTVTSVK